MNSSIPEEPDNTGPLAPSRPEPILAELVPSQTTARPAAVPAPWRRHLPLILFLATCLSTFFVGTFYVFGSLSEGLIYAASLMTILVCHEMGHYVQARRYHVPASLPYFVPVPIPPIGTMGAVIAMRPGVGDRKAMFDIGITGPLAGLVPTLVFCVVGLQHAELKQIAPRDGFSWVFNEPLLMQFLSHYYVGPRPEGHDVILNPTLFASWVGLLITSLNLIPIGQLDGGHILYALLRKKAHFVASWLLKAAMVGVAAIFVIYRQPVWILMILLLVLVGPYHPPTANDNVPLGPARIVLGWLTLAFVLVGFTPIPMQL